MTLRGKILRFPITVVDTKATESNTGITPQLLDTVRETGVASVTGQSHELAIRNAIDSIIISTSGTNIGTSGFNVLDSYGINTVNFNTISGNMAISTSQDDLNLYVNTSQLGTRYCPVTGFTINKKTFNGGIYQQQFEFTHDSWSTSGSTNYGLGIFNGEEGQGIGKILLSCTEGFNSQYTTYSIGTDDDNNSYVLSFTAPTTGSTNLIDITYGEYLWPYKVNWLSKDPSETINGVYGNYKGYQVGGYPNFWSNISLDSLTKTYVAKACNSVALLELPSGFKSTSNICTYGGQIGTLSNLNNTESELLDNTTNYSGINAFNTLTNSWTTKISTTYNTCLNANGMNIDDVYDISTYNLTKFIGGYDSTTDTISNYNGTYNFSTNSYTVGSTSNVPSLYGHITASFDKAIYSTKYNIVYGGTSTVKNININSGVVIPQSTIYNYTISSNTFSSAGSISFNSGFYGTGRAVGSYAYWWGGSNISSLSYNYQISPVTYVSTSKTSVPIKVYKGSSFDLVGEQFDGAYITSSYYNLSNTLIWNTLTSVWTTTILNNAGSFGGANVGI